MGQKCYFENPLVGEFHYKENEHRKGLLSEVREVMEIHRTEYEEHRKNCTFCLQGTPCAHSVQDMKTALEFVWEIVK